MTASGKHRKLPDSKEATPSEPSFKRTLGMTVCGLLIGLNITGNIVPLRSDIDARRDDSDLTKESSRIASKMLGEHIILHCSDKMFQQAPGGDQAKAFVSPYFFGVAPVDIGIKHAPGTIHMRKDVCETIESAFITKDDAGQTPDQASALLILSHEAEHLRGEYDEAAATCFGTQKLPERLERLGFSKNKAELTTYLAASDSWYQVPDEYKSAECHKGGKMDLKISDLYFEEPVVGRSAEVPPVS